MISEVPDFFRKVEEPHIRLPAEGASEASSRSHPFSFLIFVFNHPSIIWVEMGKIKQCSKVCCRVERWTVSYEPGDPGNFELQLRQPSNEKTTRSRPPSRNWFSYFSVIPYTVGQNSQFFDDIADLIHAWLPWIHGWIKSAISRSGIKEIAKVAE